MNSEKILKFSFLACSAYFVCMSFAHYFGLKLPILFIYYDVPYYAYQDKIISFCAFTYAILFFGAFKNKEISIYAIASLLATVIGLSLINLSGELKTLINGKTTLFYWLQTSMIAGIMAWLTVFYFCTQKSLHVDPKKVH